MKALEARAPTRIDFGGGWTDVPPYSEERGGCVCNLAIALHAVVRLREGAGEVTEPASAPGEGSLFEAAMRRVRLPGVQATLASEYPVGAGLGGSSAAGVAICGALAAWRGDELRRGELAEESRRLEVEELGIPGGRQDHYAAAFGGALGLWFEDRTSVRRIALSPETRGALEARLLVIYTGQSRISGDTITAVLDAYRARTPRVVEALDRMKRLAEVMTDALARGDVESLGALVGEHWIHQRALHPAIPTPRIDAILARGAAEGALGGKALGASGGGCVLLIAPAEGADRIRRAVADLGTLLPVRIDERGLHTSVLSLATAPTIS